MKRKVRIAQYGCGKMGKLLMRYALEKGGEIVAAFARNPIQIGKDIAEIMGTESTGVLISDSKNAEAVLCETRPDVCIIATSSTLIDVREAYEICARNGINVISTCEEALFPWNSSPKIAQELDVLAKAKNCTLSASGLPDLFWGTIVTLLSGSSAHIKKIKGTSTYNTEDCGPVLSRAHGVGLTPEQFASEMGSCNNFSSEEISSLILNGKYIPSYMWYQNGWLCSRLGLTVVSQTQKCVPCTHTDDLYSQTLGETVRSGYATGMAAIVTTVTEEGIILETECIGKIYSPGEFDKNEWTLLGEPDTTLVVDRLQTPELTCATIINRIPQVIDCKPGFITTDKMPCNIYMVKQMNDYVLNI
jgi:4-hydroxy-tetrahydrodipicolinate reductase